MYKIERISDVQSLWADPTAWDSLSGGVPMRETAWLGHWWDAFGQAHEAYVVTVRDSGGALCGALPMYRLDSNRDGRTLCAMGDGVTCTDHFTVLARPDDAGTIAAEIGRWLTRVSRDPRDGWDVIDLDGIVGGDGSAAALAEALRSEGAISHATSRMSTWFHPAADDWETYLARLSKQRRRVVRRRRERLEAIEGLQCHTAATRAEVHVGLDAVIELHQRRWTAVGEPGSFADPRSRDFLHAAAQEFFTRRQLDLTWLALHGRPIGGEMRIIGRDRVLYSYCTGIDADHGKIEPGHLLNIQGALQVYENGLRGIDYLRGDEPYKQQMQATPRPLIRLRVVAPALVPRLRHAAWRTGFEFKQFIRRRTGRTPFRTLSLD